MKRYGNLWEKIISVENIMEAHKNARKGKGHYKAVERFNRRPYHHARHIRHLLKNGLWIPTAYTPMVIADRGKPREILKVNYYPDRVIHHAIMQVVQPILERCYIKDTYQSIQGRGVHQGLQRIKSWMKDESGTKYTLKMDIRKFYPSVDNAILKQLLRKKIKCQPTLAALDRLVDSTDGLPIGNYTSQTLGNFYLAFFDHWIKQELGAKYYIRYADDMVIMSESKETLHEMRQRISVYLQQHLHLKLKGNWQVFPTRKRGVDFLGYRLFGHYTLIRKKIARSMMRAWKRPVHDPSDISRVVSYAGWALWADAYNLLRKYLPDVKKKVAQAAKQIGIKNPLRNLYLVQKPERKPVQLTLF